MTGMLVWLTMAMLSAPRLDAHGFPLPEGALARIGDRHFAQPEYIAVATMTPDAGLIATAGAGEANGKDATVHGISWPRHEGRVFLWNAATRKMVRELTTPDRVARLAFSSDGRSLVAGLEGGNLQMWLVATGEPLWRTNLPYERKSWNSNFTALHFLDRDQLLAARHDNLQVHLWDVRTGLPKQVWDREKLLQDQLQRLGPGHTCRAVCLSPSGERMAWLIAGSDTVRCRSVVFVFETASGRLVRQASGLPPSAESIHLLDEGQTALLQTSDSFQPPEQVFAQVVGAFWQLVTGSGNNTVVDLRTGLERFRFADRAAGHAGHARVLAFDVVRQRLTMCDCQGPIVWDLRTGKPQLALRFDPGDHIAARVFSADGSKHLKVNGCRMQFYDAQFKPLGPVAAIPEIPQLYYLSGERLLLYSHRSASAQQVWQPTRGELCETRPICHVHRLGVSPLALNYTEGLFVHLQSDGIVVDNLRTGKQRCRLAGVQVEHPNSVCYELSQDGQRVLVT